MALDLAGKEIVRYPEGTKVRIKDIGRGVIRGIALDSPMMMWIVEVTAWSSHIHYPYSCVVAAHFSITKDDD